MPYSSFKDKFPNVDNLILDVSSDPVLPPGRYGIFELYCADPGCDCRRVMLSFMDLSTREIKADIAYGWGSKQFYSDWLGDKDPLPVKMIKIKGLQGPILNPLSYQSEIAPALLEIVKSMVVTNKLYLSRFKKHYRMYKDAIDNKTVGTVVSLQSAMEKKISRNSPCPCGSGKKYKSCCGRLHVTCKERDEKT
jgi:hypothetical protein